MEHWHNNNIVHMQDPPNQKSWLRPCSMHVALKTNPFIKEVGDESSVQSVEEVELGGIGSSCVI